MGAHRLRQIGLVGPVCWMISTALLLAVEVVVPLAWTIPWNPSERAISDLGAVTCGPVSYADGLRDVCSPWHQMANVSWIVAGLALAVGSLLARRRLPGAAGVGAIILLFVTGLSTCATGLFPIDTQAALHLVTAAPGFFTGSLGLIMAAVTLRSGSPALSRAALALALIGFLGTALTITWTVSGGPLGLWERLAVYPVQLWVVAAAVSWGNASRPAPWIR